MVDATPELYLAQVQQALSTYRERVAGGLPAVERIHINFMARGEALANRYLLADPGSVFDPMGRLVEPLGVDVRFLVSSILPNTLDRPLEQVLQDDRSSLYYSLYSLNPAFRKRWLPKALSGEDGLDRCAQYQRCTGRTVVLHWAFIAGQNDADRDVEAIVRAVSDRGLRVRFNLVRYNPHDGRHGVETDPQRLAALFERLREGFGDAQSRIVPRVGHDVMASCGMFVT